MQLQYSLAWCQSVKGLSHFLCDQSPSAKLGIAPDRLRFEK